MTPAGAVGLPSRVSSSGYRSIIRRSYHSNIAFYLLIGPVHTWALGLYLADGMPGSGRHSICPSFLILLVVLTPCFSSPSGEVPQEFCPNRARWGARQKAPGALWCSGPHGRGWPESRLRELTPTK